MNKIKLNDLPSDLMILGAAVETGLIEQLHQGPATLTELAAKLKGDKRAVWVVTEALEALGMVKKDDAGRWTLTDDLKEVLYSNLSPDYIGFSFMHRYNLVRNWSYLPEIIKTGKPCPRSDDPKYLDYFIEAMQHNARQSAPAIARFLLGNAQTGTRIVDIGGGPLLHAKEWTKFGAEVTVLDIPPVVEMNKDLARALKIQLVPGDFLETLPEGQFDIAYLGNICHIVSEEENRSLFSRVAGILVRGGCIAIVDFIRGTNPGAAVFGVNMLVNTERGGTYTMNQYSQWLESAGFANIQLDIVEERQIITARKI